MLFIYLLIATITAKQAGVDRPPAPQEDPKNVIQEVLKQLQAPKGKNRMPNYLPNDSNDGFHGFKQFHLIMKTKGLSYQEAKMVFEFADEDKDNKISDSEWIVFHRLIIKPYESCLEDDDYFLDIGEAKKCFQESGYFNSTNLLIDELATEEVFSLMGTQELSLYNYIFLRKLDRSFQECAINNAILANKIFCAIQITSPRVGQLDPATEKQLFITGTVLSTGFYSKTTLGLDFLEFLEVSYYFNFFVDYEIPVENGFVSKRDVIRAQQENMLDLRFLPSYSYQLFNDIKEDKLSVSACLGMFYSFRNWVENSNGFTLTKANWLKFIKKDKFPSRMTEAYSMAFIPSEDEYEVASQRLYVNKTEENLMMQFNTMIFLQEKNQLNLRKASKQFSFRQKKDSKKKDDKKKEPQYNYTFNYPADVQQNIISYPTQQDDKMQAIYNTPFPDQKTGFDIIFNQFDRYQNNSMCFKDWLTFIRISFLFTHYNHLDQSNYYNFRTIELARTIIRRRKIYLRTLKPFSFKPSSKIDFTQNYMQETYTQFINIKEFFAYFQKEEVCQLILQQGFQFTSPRSRTDQCLYMLGLRISDYNKQVSLMGFSTTSQEQTYRYEQTFDIALREDILATYIRIQQSKLSSSNNIGQKDEKKKEPRFKNLKGVIAFHIQQGDSGSSKVTID